MIILKIFDSTCSHLCFLSVFLLFSHLFRVTCSAELILSVPGVGWWGGGTTIKHIQWKPFKNLAFFQVLTDKTSHFTRKLTTPFILLTQGESPTSVYNSGGAGWV